MISNRLLTSLPIFSRSIFASAQPPVNSRWVFFVSYICFNLIIWYEMIWANTHLIHFFCVLHTSTSNQSSLHNNNIMLSLNVKQITLKNALIVFLLLTHDLAGRLRRLTKIFWVEALPRIRMMVVVANISVYYLLPFKREVKVLSWVLLLKILLRCRWVIHCLIVSSWIGLIWNKSQVSYLFFLMLPMYHNI